MVTLRSTTKIILVGPMGAGKSSIGFSLADAMGINFWDTDAEVIHRVKKSIADIFAQEGEATFRRYEEEALADLLASSESMVIATGGGIVLSAHNRELLKQHPQSAKEVPAIVKKVIYLSVSVHKQWQRIKLAIDKDKTKDVRPLFPSDNPTVELKHMAQLRNPLYQEVADDVIETDDFTVTEIIRTILQLPELCQ